MKLIIEGLEVLFPYDFVYEEQVKYMKYIKDAMDAAYNANNSSSSSGHCLLEMPTGTGKTACLLAIIIAYKKANPRAGKLIYCTRTVPEMNKCMQELRKLVDARTKAYGPETTVYDPSDDHTDSMSMSDSNSNSNSNRSKRVDFVGESLFGICLSSRKNMCINEHILEKNDVENVDVLCREKTASWIRNQTPKDEEKLCKYYEGLESLESSIEVPRGVYDLEGLKTLGGEKSYCPYFLARKLILYADVVVFNYQYLIDPRIFNMVSKEFEKNCTIVFDEAHNIDNVCMEVMSVSLDSNLMNKAIGNLKQLRNKIKEVKGTHRDKLNNEYRELRDGLMREGLLGMNPSASAMGGGGGLSGGGGGGFSNGGFFADGANNSTNNVSINNNNPINGNLADSMRGSPLTPLDPAMIEEAMPGSIRKAEHFLEFMKIVVTFLKGRVCENNESNESSTFRSGYQKTLLAFLHDLERDTALERKTLKFSHSRLNSLLRTLELTNLDDFHPISEVANFATLISSFIEGFAVIFEPEGLLHLTCLDASIAMKPIASRFRSVIITSGTLSPRSLYEKMLGIKPVVSESLAMSSFRDCLRPLIVSKVDLTDISTRFEDRTDKSMADSYGSLLVDICKNVPDGVCCFLPSYQYLEEIVTSWEANGTIAKILKHKLIFIETKDVVETTLALDMYKKACDRGQGAVFLSIARGKVAEGVDFDRHYGRAVIVMGIPFGYARCPQLLARQAYLREQYNVTQRYYSTFDAIRQVSQCIGRVLRSKTDYGIVILADYRFNKQDIIRKFPEWIQTILDNKPENKSVDSMTAVDKVKDFLREMGQAWDPESLRKGVTHILLDEDDVKRRPSLSFANPANYRHHDIPTGGSSMSMGGGGSISSTTVSMSSSIIDGGKSTQVGNKRDQNVATIDGISSIDGSISNIVDTDNVLLKRGRNIQNNSLSNDDNNQNDNNSKNNSSNSSINISINSNSNSNSSRSLDVADSSMNVTSSFLT